MVTYCACCGERVSLPRRDARILLGPGQQFVCPECRALQLKEAKSPEQSGEDQAPSLERSSSC